MESTLAADLWFWRETLLVTVRARSLAAASRRRAAGPPPSRRRIGAFSRLVETAREFRAAGRRLRRSPGFAVPAILTLALGIGACAAVLTVV
jgi:hypothetical protein